MPDSSKVNEIPFFDSPYVIYEGRAWNVILHRDNQSYLGRSIVYLKSRIIDNPLLLTPQERDELWTDILPRLAEALERSFQPDRINFSHLANAEHFVHWHIIPRYEKDPLREFSGETFKDERVGGHYAPIPFKTVTPEVMQKIYLTLKGNFKVLQ
jgi:diadenosine tetraphosphate (Ap4A) HIT family hydrolase